MRRPKHGHRRGWGRWKARAPKRREWAANEINRVTKEWLNAGAGNKLANAVFGERREEA